MHTPARFAAVVMSFLIAQFVASPAQAHLTDPSHAEWVAGFQSSPETTTMGPGEQFQTDTVLGIYQAAVPFDGIKVAPRAYDFTFPEGFTLSDTYFSTSYGSGDCQINNNTVHCESGIDFLETTAQDVLVIGGTTGQVADAIYQISMTSTITIYPPGGGDPEATYTDTDTMPIKIATRRSADLAATGPTGKPTLPIGQPTKFNVHARNFGPDAARSVVYNIELGETTTGTISTSTTGCTSIRDRVICEWDTIASGATKTVELVVTLDSGPMYSMLGDVLGYENDPRTGNNSWVFSTRTR